MTEESDRFADWDAAYVLGALPPTERREFETHLRGCEACAAAVGELAAMPSLLGTVSAEQALRLLEAEPPRPEPVPDLLPRLVHAVARGRRRRRFALAGALIAASAAVLLTFGIAQSAARPTEHVTLASLVDSPLSADVEVTAQSWGTQVEMDCSYRRGASEGPPTQPPWGYQLAVTDTRGQETIVSRWKAGPGQTVHTSGSVDLAVAEIASFEVQATATGDVLLQGDLDLN
ncbi:MAG: putative transrane anti-sigma factor [Naasia sp.]|uniref:anti-sigma factor family protein n=1 Tax=Naasia sp. TaxID=2546198 RepID=UPI002626D924|nr:zf-HC2 domain-containing protein [Naasia sp.]MCU1571421.1 putative transrane anti-sigma factor [Naasia sp.]